MNTYTITIDEELLQIAARYSADLQHLTSALEELARVDVRPVQLADYKGLTHALCMAAFGISSVVASLRDAAKASQEGGADA